MCFTIRSALSAVLKNRLEELIIIYLLIKPDRHLVKFLRSVHYALIKPIFKAFGAIFQ